MVEERLPLSELVVEKLGEKEELQVRENDVLNVHDGLWDVESDDVLLIERLADVVWLSVELPLCVNEIDRLCVLDKDEVCVLLDEWLFVKLTLPEKDGENVMLFEQETLPDELNEMECVEDDDIVEDIVWDEDSDDEDDRLIVKL